MKFVTIDGTDKSGKSTLIVRLIKETNGLVLVMDRSPSGWHFFNKLLDRDLDSPRYDNEYKNMLKKFRPLVDLSIVLTVNEEDWKDRCKKHEEPELVGNLSFIDHQKELHNYFNKAKYKNVLKLNTSEMSEDKCISLIYKRLGIRRK